MTTLPKKAPVTNLLEKLSPEDLDKIQAYQSTSEGAYPVDEAWMILAEWLKIAGYQAYLDARDDARDEKGNLIITMPEILTLIEANRKLEALQHYKNAHAVLIGTGSAQSKKPSNTFKSLTREIIKRTKVQEL